MTSAFMVLAFQMAFYVFISCAYYYGWADDTHLPQKTEPESPERLWGVKVMAIPMVGSFFLTLFVILH